MTLDNSSPKDGVELQDVSNYLSAHEQQSDEVRSNNSSSPPEHAVTAYAKWNESKSNIFKTMSTFFGFVIMGANDAAYGAIASLSLSH